MGNNFFAIYDTLIRCVSSGDTVVSSQNGDHWAMAETKRSTGIAMRIPGESIGPMFPEGLCGLSLKEAAQAAKSWNLTEAGLGLAAANAALNTPERMEALGCYEPFENYCTAGMDFTGKTVAMIGHMHGTEEMRRLSKAIYIIEREPQAGDYPDSACDLILPQCDIVLITGSTLVNKTLPHLLELCRNSCTILTGPSVPMCPELLEHGIDRLAGLVLEDREAIRAHVLGGRRGSPYFCGRPFLLKR